MSLFTNPNRIHENYGLKIGVALILYFVIMNLIGLAYIVELRLFNVVIQAAGVYFALKKFRKTHHDHLNYFRALATGVAAGAIGSILLGVFMFVYMKLDPSLLQAIVSNEVNGSFLTMGHYLNPYMSGFIVAFEGAFSGLLVTFVLINYVETDEADIPASE